MLIPIKSAKYSVLKNDEKHRRGLPSGWGHEAPKEHSRKP